MNEHTDPYNAKSVERTVVRLLLDFINKHRLEHGDKIPSERDLALRFDVGRNAVREAIVTLTTLRILETRPNSGVYLRQATNESSVEALLMLSNAGVSPSYEEIRESMEAREILELRAIELACERRTYLNLEALRQVNDAMKQVVDAGGNITELDTQFHIELASAAQNKIVVRILNTFYILSAPRRKVLFADPKRAKIALREHISIVNALEASDAVRARQIVEKHIQRARHYWSHLFPMRGEASTERLTDVHQGAGSKIVSPPVSIKKREVHRRKAEI
jgi:GntR family transcriptional repressor for pyruvate dehydrogenase complex